MSEATIVWMWCSRCVISSDRLRNTMNVELIRYIARETRKHREELLLGVGDQRAALHLEEGQKTAQVHTTIGIIWALNFNDGDEVVLSPEKHRESLCVLPPVSLGDAFGRGLDYKIHLMRRAPDTQDVVIGAGDDPGNQTGVAASPRVIAIRRHADQLVTPGIV